MQIHWPASHLDQIDVRIVPGRPGPFAIVSFGSGAELFLESRADAEKLILAGLKAKALLPETSAEDDAGRAIAADLDEQRGGTDAS